MGKKPPSLTAAEEQTRMRVLLDEAQRLARLGSWEWREGHGLAVSEEARGILPGLGPEAGLDGLVALVHGDDRENLRAALRRLCESGGRVTLSHRLAAPEDEERIVRTVIEALKGADGCRLLATVQDVTEQVRAEKESRYRTAMLRYLLGMTSWGREADAAGGLSHFLRETARYLDCRAARAYFLEPPSARDAMAAGSKSDLWLREGAPASPPAPVPPRLDDILPDSHKTPEPAWHAGPSVARAAPQGRFGSVLRVPVGNGGKRFAVLELWYPAGEAAPPPDGLQAVALTAAHVAGSLERLAALGGVRESLALFQATLDALPANVAVLDRKGRITFVNESWTRFAEENGAHAAQVGVGADYLAAYSLSGLDPRPKQDSVAEIVPALRDVLDGRSRAFSREYPCHAPSERRWFKLLARHLGDDPRAAAVVMHVDVTDVYLAREDMARSQRELASVAGNLPGVVVQFAPRADGALALTYLPERVHDILDEESAGRVIRLRTLDAMIHPEDRSSVHAQLNAAEALDAPLDVEFRSSCAGRGGARWLRLIASRTFPDARDKEGADERGHEKEEATWDAILLDISAFKDEERRRAEVEERLRRASKMESLGRLAAGMAHEFNNLLTPIMGMVELSLRSLPETAPERANLAVALQAGDAAKGLVAKVLTFGAQDEAPDTVLDLTAAVSDCLDFVQGVLPASVRLVTRFDAPSPKVLLDREDLRRILVNLFTNAVDAMGARNGAVTVRVGLSAPPAQALHGAPSGPGPDGEWVRLDVEDTGEGMEDDVLERIFEPFFTTREVGAGQGLGLTVVHALVLKHDGVVTVASRKGEGSTFSIFWPVVPATAEVEATYS